MLNACELMFSDQILTGFHVIGLDSLQKLKILEKNGNLFSSFVGFWYVFCCFQANATSSSSSAAFFALRRAFGPPRYRLLLLLT